MKSITISKKDFIKSWETLSEEVSKSGLTSLLCCQDFEATKADSMEDNGWGELDEDGLPIGECENFDWQTAWKHDTMFRMLDENLNYGKWEETEEELNDPRPMHHSAMMDIRCTIAEDVAWAWIFGNNGLPENSDAYQSNEVNSIETAQALADKLIEEIDYNKFLPITA